MIVGVTGAEGFLGWHLRALLRVTGAHETRLATRSTFAAPERLRAFVAGVDAIVHLAGMNRGPDADVQSGNVALAASLVDVLTATGARPQVVFANSVHVERDTAYGRGKRAAAALLRAWAAGADAPFADLMLPHVFGEHGRPFYNSVVSTFCHQLASRQTPEVVVDSELELVHAQRAARRCLQAAEQKENGTIRVHGTPMKVSALLDKLTYLMESYAGQLMPALPGQIDLELFNTFRSYLYPDHYPVALPLHSDVRGSLFEAIKSMDGGQTFLSVTRSGVTRGNHFHTRKIERFLVVVGEAQIRLRRLFTEGVRTFPVSGAQPCYIDMPTFHTHEITNTGSGELVTLFWTNEIYDPDDSDTYPEPVTR